MGSIQRTRHRQAERNQAKDKESMSEQNDSAQDNEAALAPTQPSAETPAAPQVSIERKDFTKAEFKRLRDLAGIANHAMNEYNGFIAFLREQHEIEADNQAWQLGEKGFVCEAVQQKRNGES
jgi:hypothetical protein